MSFGVDGNQFEQFLVSSETAREDWFFVVLPPVRIESGKLRLVFTACPTDNQSDVVGLTCSYREVTRRVTTVILVLIKTCLVLLPGTVSRGSPDERVNGFPCGAERSLAFNLEVVELFHVSFLGELYRTFHSSRSY